MDPEIDRIARMGHGKLKYHNASRKLHNYVHKEGKTFPVSISTCKLRIKNKKTAGEVDVLWPVLRLGSWLQVLFEHGGAEIMLGGFQVQQDDMYKPMFSRFWHHFRTLDAAHPVYTKSQEDMSMTIPVCLHGDEGRGLAKIPVMVESIQPCIPWMGEENLNSLGNLASIET